MLTMTLGVTVRVLWICLFLSEICCQHRQQGLEGHRQRFGNFYYLTRPAGSDSVPSMNDVSSTKGEGVPNYNEPAKENPFFSKAEVPHAPTSQRLMPSSQVWMPSTQVSQDGMSKIQANPVWTRHTPTQESQGQQSVSQAAKMAQAQMPPAPVSQAAQMPKVHAHVPPIWAKMPPAPVSQAAQMPKVQAHVPPIWAKMPPAPVNQMPKVHAQMPLPQMTASNPIKGSLGSSSMDVGAETTRGDAEGPSSGQERFLVITEPSGFQTRYVVKSFNRYVLGKMVFSQTTYIPLDFLPTDAADPVAYDPSFPGHEAQADQTVDVKE
ncbi:uncharacterized protein LOC116224083 [Clupea harengus]|uniref:Uncharacterized protein LOC116224083 n=1 Tax=Clupea harengus TaxID=7950 RepID=A0A6P8GUY5_CLUHA|nr:uncharacterized protein LOC116224083 [Clupea harengus]